MSKKPLPPIRVFYLHLLQNIAIALCLTGFSLYIGAAGYHYLDSLGWVDSYLNASMILAGMGPVDAIHTDAAKIFATCYALYSGIAFLSFVALIFAPVYLRFLHKFHLDTEKE